MSVFIYIFKLTTCKVQVFFWDLSRSKINWLQVKVSNFPEIPLFCRFLHNHDKKKPFQIFKVKLRTMIMVTKLLYLPFFTETVIFPWS